MQGYCSGQAVCARPRTASRTLEKSSRELSFFPDTQPVCSRNRMELVRRAIIDIGTNSVKLLVADVTGRHVIPIWEGSEQTRLGRGFYETHRLSPAAVAATGHAAAGFAKKAGDLRAVSIRVIATSAARDARNVEDLIHAVRNASGLDMEILSGEQEADLAFQGVTTDSRYADSPFLLLEVGGGSSQFILGDHGTKAFTRSFQIGTVRLMEAVPHVSPESDQDLAQTRKWLKRVAGRRSGCPAGTRVAARAPVLAARYGAATRGYGRNGQHSGLHGGQAGRVRSRPVGIGLPEY